MIVRATHRAKNALSEKEQIGLRVGHVISPHKMEKHFDLTITETSFSYARGAENIKAEAAIDGLYLIRSSVPKETMTAEQLVSTNKSLAQVERVCRSLKSIDRHVCQIYHFNNDREAAQKLRRSVLASTKRSKPARVKDATFCTESDLLVQCFQDLLKDLAMSTRITF